MHGSASRVKEGDGGVGGFGDGSRSWGMDLPNPSGQECLWMQLEINVLFTTV